MTQETEEKIEDALMLCCSLIGAIGLGLGMAFSSASSTPNHNGQQQTPVFDATHPAHPLHPNNYLNPMNPNGFAAPMPGSGK